MYNRYSDFEELRPTGEASHIPDTRLGDECEGTPGGNASRRALVATPDAPTVTDGESFRSWGVSPRRPDEMPVLSHQPSRGGATSTNETASTTFLGIVHLIVESTTFYGAVAKGGAAANLLSANEAEPAVDDYTLIYDLDEAPARQLVEQWPSLPDAVQVSSEGRAASLSAARDGAGWHEQGASERQEQAPRRLYDQHGDGIRDASRSTRSSTTPTMRCGLVPAMALTESAREDKTNSQVSLVPTSQDLDCQACGRATDHQFKIHESVPAAAWTGQPIWECRVCGSARYGPSLE